MIVKNESKIILRALESAVPFIDGLVIMDTGSTDNTIELIEGFMAKYPTLFGRVISQPIAPDDFTFSGARTAALEHCIEFADRADYVLFMDADMVLEIGDPLFSIELWTAPHPKAYHIVQKSTIFNSNVRLLPLIAEDIRAAKVLYRTYTHEYISHNYNIDNIPYERLGIKDIGDGGAKGDKLQRDLRLLLRGLREDAADLKGRYLFYLGETYRFWADCGHEPDIRNALLTCSIKHYSERAAIANEWIQEVWYSHYAMGKCYMAMIPPQPDKAVYCWMMAYEVYPHRIENLYACVDYFCMTARQYKLAHFYYNLAAAVLEDGECSNLGTRESQLFLQRDIYTYGLQFIYSVLAPYMGIRDLNKEVVVLLNCDDLPDHLYLAVLNNLKFYNTQLNIEDTAVIEYPFVLPTTADNNGSGAGFINSSACIVSTSDELSIWVRYVNYRITKATGAYTLLPEGEHRIITRNVAYRLTKGLQVCPGSARELEFNMGAKADDDNQADDLAIKAETPYVGIEDVRAFNPRGTSDILFIGTGWHSKTQTLGMMFGRYNAGAAAPANLKACEIVPAFKEPKECEKNWVFCDYGGRPHIIYEWYGPIEGVSGGHVIICAIHEQETPMTIHMRDAKPVPPIFRHVRGSTSGVWRGDNEIWFLVHLVAYGSPRNYYHMFAVFDADMNFKGHSAPFTFEGAAVEYCLSLHVLKGGGRIAACYSVWDSCTKVAIYNWDDIVLYPASAADK